MADMERLRGLLGQERDVDDVARELYRAVKSLDVPVVGAMHVTCADESEHECADAFQRGFSQHVLPNLKFGQRSHFRLANLGARYEPGAVHIAEQHYATVATRRAAKLMLVKFNSHVSAEPTAAGTRFGSMERYDVESVYCGALHALMDGARLPFADDLRRAFSRDGADRLGVLLDEQRTPRTRRSLLVAAVNAGVQARGAVADILDHPPTTPTLFVVMACVTLNRKQKDTEIVCGIHRVDRTGNAPSDDYRGVGDDPAVIDVVDDRGRVSLVRRA